MLKKQILITGIVFWICVLLINLFRPQVPINAILKDKYLSDKIYWKDRFDIAIIGDSRTLIDISPRMMEKILPDYKIGNLGFIALVYSQDYLDYSRNSLRQSGEKRIIVVCFSTGSLLSHLKKVCHFRKALKTARKHYWIEPNKRLRWFQMLFDQLPEDDFSNPNDKIPSQYLMVPFESGWMACRRFPEIIKLSDKQYRRRFVKNKTDEKLIDVIYKNTKSWTADGIKVFGVRLPTAPSLYIIEQELSGFKEQDIRRGFKENGGIWLDPPINNLVAYDGSHLRYDSAAVYSKRLAIELKKYLDKTR